MSGIAHKATLHRLTASHSGGCSQRYSDIRFICFWAAGVEGFLAIGFGAGRQEGDHAKFIAGETNVLTGILELDSPHYTFSTPSVQTFLEQLSKYAAS